MDQQLRDTVKNAQAGRIEIKIVEELDAGRGKPKRVIEKRKFNNNGG
jgi:hypothetical protein